MKSIGILGGGQLGKMLCLAAGDWDLETYVLDTEGCSAQPYCKHFVAGNFKNYDDVVAFGRMVDVVTVEIEHVNTDALRQLVAEGKSVHPNPDILDLIKDKGNQKEFYLRHHFPTADTHFFDTKSDLLAFFRENAAFPKVWKARRGGYDGKGVSILKKWEEVEALPDTPCIVEEMVDLAKELAVIVARNPSGQIVSYPSVEMEFDAKANLLDLQLCPANIAPEEEAEARRLAETLMRELNLFGLLAVEMFLTRSGAILINEIAPRPHNSGHHTIEACETSQYEQHLRAVLDLPLGSTAMRLPSVLMNLLGAEGYEGVATVDGFENALRTEGVHVHLYGKKTTKPFRKMGHVTILDADLQRAYEKAIALKNTLKVISIP